MIFIKRKFKIVFSILIALCAVLCLAMSISAASANAAKPYYSETQSVTLSLTFSSEGAACYGNILGKPGTTTIDKCTFTLKDSKGTTVKTWSDLSSTGATLIFSKTASAVTQGEIYSLSVTATVHRNGNSEKVSDSITVKYN